MCFFFPPKQATSDGALEGQSEAGPTHWLAIPEAPDKISLLYLLLFTKN